jgi:shikimate kinase
MDELLFKLLEQTPVIIVLSISLYALWNKLSNKEKEAIQDRKIHRKEIKELNERQATETKELNEYIREHEKGHLEALDKLSDALDSLKR